MIQAVSWVTKIKGQSKLLWRQGPPGEGEHPQGISTQTAGDLVCSLFPCPSHVEKSQTLPTVLIISKTHCNFCEQHSTSMMGSESHTLLAPHCLFCPPQPGSHSSWTQRQWDWDGHGSSKGTWGTHQEIAWSFLDLIWDILAASLFHGSFSVGLTLMGDACTRHSLPINQTC